MLRVSDHWQGRRQAKAMAARGNTKTITVSLPVELAEQAE